MTQTPIIIQATNARVAAYHIPELVLGAVFPIIYVWIIHPATHLPFWAKTILGVCALLCTCLVFYTIVQIGRKLRAKTPWKVTIDAERLVWNTGLPHPDFPLNLRLGDIKELVSLETWTTGSDNESCVEQSYEIHLQNGQVITIEQTHAGLNPDRVFLMLKERGLTYAGWQQDFRENPDASRTLRKTF